MQSKPQQPTNKHHYIPVFYTSGWTRQNFLYEYGKRQHGKVLPRKTSPDGTGYAKGLYELKGFPAELSQQVEEGFFKLIDGLASQALSKLRSGCSMALLSVDEKSSWSRFIISMLLRCPEDVEEMRRKWDHNFERVDPALELQFARTGRHEDRFTLVNTLSNIDPIRREKYLFEAFLPLIDNKRIGETLNGMAWRVLDLSSSSHALLTSDRPVLRTNNFIDHDSHIVVPISPTQLFVAVKEIEVLDDISRISPNQLVRAVNRASVCSAVKFVWSSDTAQSNFIKKHFSTVQQDRLVSHILKDERA
ncbi:DUF4238 domain-containing protein [Aurantimonas coralicida]|uniref:DUF4238 domain-containing protein n=1 Tax=Aurantimonas coralicida TaxID=182270 RepID=UPI001E4CD63B|nr:DUF4238 domain-containing protein [Aurantimonas coralicida]MCD1642474.1 DUF4238 domain-containing protein [Aurantimonas coralicida]